MAGRRKQVVEPVSEGSPKSSLDGMDDESRAMLLATMSQTMPLYFIEHNRSQDKFIRVKNRFGRTPKRRIWESGNKNGKTFLGIAEDIARACGFRCWLQKGDPDYLVDIKVPNIGLIAGETVVHSIGEKIEPVLRMLIPPQCRPEWKAGATGVLLRVTLRFDPWGGKCGSQIYLRSYDQKPATFEGIDYDWVHFDEPPPEPILKAVERGKVVSNARSWYTMTPLKEPYIWDLFSRTGCN